MSESSLYLLAELTGKALKNAGHTMATAESCTGGGVMQAMTEVPGSSDWCQGGFITYSNAAKMQLLGVSKATLQKHGAVSKQTVLSMAEGALSRCDATVSVAVSGVAGPGGGTDEKPVGTVWVAWAGGGSPARAEKFLFEGDRGSVRRQAVFAALDGIIALCQK